MDSSFSQQEKNLGKRRNEHQHQIRAPEPREGEFKGMLHALLIGFGNFNGDPIRIGFREPWRC